MDGTNKKFAHKVEEASELATRSRAMNRLIEMTAAEWVGILAELDEKELDEFLYVMNEERDGYEEIEKKRQRRHQVNDTRRLQRLERLKIRMEELSERIK